MKKTTLEYGDDMILVYAHFAHNGGTHLQAWPSQKEANAAEYVISTISNSIRGVSPKSESPFAAYVGDINVFGGGEAPRPKKKPKAITDDGNSQELKALQEHLQIALKAKTIDNARKAILLYEEYLTYIKLTPSKLHSLQQVRLMED